MWESANLRDRGDFCESVASTSETENNNWLQCTYWHPLPSWWHCKFHPGNTGILCRWCLPPSALRCSCQHWSRSPGPWPCNNWETERERQRMGECVLFFAVKACPPVFNRHHRHVEQEMLTWCRRCSWSPGPRRCRFLSLCRLVCSPSLWSGWWGLWTGDPRPHRLQWLPRGWTAKLPGCRSAELGFVPEYPGVPFH